MASPPQAECLMAAGLTAQVILPNSPEYASRIESYFDNAAKLHPTCLVQPRNAEEVATTVKALAEAGHVFAVRAGGCTNRAGSNNIEGGVTIDLRHLDFVDYDPATETVRLGPGAAWKAVYDTLDKFNRSVSGGRVGSVGVGGYLLGGGLSFFSGRSGFSCDSVVAYEIALADGSVIKADAESHEDLFRALKGGGNNFGVVTNFIMRTFPSKGPLWGGMALRPPNVLPQASQAFENFTANMPNDPDSTTIFVAGHQPQFGGDGLLTLCFNSNTTGAENPKQDAFDEFMALPETFSSYKSGKIQDILPFSELPLGYFNIWYTLTFKNDATIVSMASDQLFKLAKDIQAQIPNNDFSTHCAFQPIPRLYAQRSSAAGGNVLGLDSYTYDAVMMQASASVRTAELADWVRPRVESLIEAVQVFAGEERLSPWLYLNYAHSSQDVLKGYGQENVQKIRDAARKYDPEGVFQRLCPGGFKVSSEDA